MNDAGRGESDADAAEVDGERDELASGGAGERPRTVPGSLVSRLSDLGASAQAAIPGVYAWAITVAPAAWARSAPWPAKLAAFVGLVALLTAPLVEGAVTRSREARAASARAGGEREPRPRTLLPSSWPADWSGATWARVWSVWGLVLSSAIVWALSPAALSSARLDGVRGALGLVGWGLFAFASAGPALRPDVGAGSRIVAGSPLKPRSELPRGDGAYVAVGVVLALAMQLVGWNIVVPERAVLVRLVTVASGIAVLGGMTSIALTRHMPRAPASARLRMRRASPWVVLLALGVCAGVALQATR